MPQRLCDPPRTLEEFKAWVERVAAQWDFTTELLKAAEQVRDIEALREDMNQLQVLRP